MKLRRALVASLGLLVLAASPSTARALGVGLEAGVSFADATSFSVGLILDQAFVIDKGADTLPSLDLTLWADIQTGVTVGETVTVGTPPFTYSATGHSTYYPVDGGLRLGFVSDVEPYLGLVVGGLFRNANAKPSSIVTLGGDLGADVHLGSFRLGFELRATSLLSTQPAGTWLVQLLGSVRYVFF